MTTKLHINIAQGIVDVEGDPELVREVYRDFRDQLLSKVIFATPTPSATPAPKVADEPKDDTPAKPKEKRRTSVKKKGAREEGSNGVVADSPKLDKNLDTAGLPAFYERYEVKNHPQKVLIFLKFLTDELGIESPNTDQFYTCYEKVNERIPKVFSQAFRDASGRKFGYINYNSPTDIRITTVGNNYFKFDLPKKAAE